MKYSEKQTLVILTRDQDDFEKRIKSLELPELEIEVPRNDEEVEAVIGKATILLAIPMIACKWINKATNLKWMQSTFAGVDAMNGEGLRKDYLLTNVRETYGVPMAEYVMGYILSFHRENLENAEAQKKKQWRQKSYETLEGKVLTILGTGSIGKEIARVGKAFGMQTLGYRKNDSDAEYFDKVYRAEEGLKEVLSRADYVVNVLPHTKDTVDIINEENISFMKPSSVFINVGRGSAVDVEALVRALNEKRLAGAVLDVFKEEPLPGDSDLWEVENLIITAHVSGYILTDRISEIFRENYRRFREGEELLYLVDLEKGY